MKSLLTKCFCLALAVPALGAEPIDYAKQVKPILVERCVACHGALKQEGGLRLDATSLIRKGGDSGSALERGKPAASLLIKRVTAGDPDVRMPPEGKPLTRQQIHLLRAWIEQGGKAPDDEPVPVDPRSHWAFQPPGKSVPPVVSAAWARNDLDRFIAALHQQQGLRAVGQANRATLLRRVYLDLIGLPPTREQLRTFLDDKSSNAFERAVDGLLASPRYGQRWARHWMDVWRYSDPSGYGKEIRDGRAHLWRWRDWIIDSLNNDKGYDRMVVEMLAADEAAPSDPDALRATGFLARNWYKFNRNVWLDNIVEHSSKAFLGLTTNCARCHDHKYDPITQREYFQLRAVFEAHDIRDDPFPSGDAMLVRAFDAHLARPTFLFLQGDQRRPDKEQRLEPRLPALFGDKLEIKPIDLPAQAFYPALRAESQRTALAKADQQIATAKSRIVKADDAVERSRQTLASFKEPTPPPKTNTAKSSKTDEPPAGKTLLADGFAQLDTKRWLAEGGNWTIADGRLVQDHGDTVQYRLLSRIDHPRDFHVRVRLRITGGEMWRSVGLGFDGHGKAMNAVYLSAFSGGTKLQATVQNSAGTWAYPQTAAKTHPLKLNQEYVLEILVRDRLMNVLLDGRPMIAFVLPADRKAGRISLFTFSATASFDDLELKTLPAGVKLVGNSPPGKPAKPLSAAALRVALDNTRALARIARLHLASVAAAQESLVARYAAERTKYGLEKGDIKQRALAAGQAERMAAIRSGEELIARDQHQLAESKRKLANGDASAKKALTAAEKNLAAHTKQLAAATKKSADGSSGYHRLGTVSPKTSTGRRLVLAQWITARSNPLAARVAVNHIWLRHFDSPLVERMFDFGLRSPKPQHAELLDWLAVRFMEDGWSMKRLHKLIVTSGVYRLSSSSQGAAASNRTIDADNLLLWRHNTRRMDAEVVRDSVLHVGGSLDVTGGGPPIDHNQGQTVPRRSIFFRQDKERQMTFLSLFDGAKVNECYRRKATVAPQQALAMYNSKISATQADRIAERIKLADNAQFVTAIFEQVLCRRPTEREARQCIAFLNDLPDRTRARKQLALVLLNHNDFITIR